MQKYLWIVAHDDDKFVFSKNVPVFLKMKDTCVAGKHAKSKLLICCRDMTFRVNVHACEPLTYMHARTFALSITCLLARTHAHCRKD